MNPFLSCSSICIVLLSCLMICHAGKLGTTEELYDWYPTFKGSKKATKAFHCIASGLHNSSKERKVYSQVGEDGLIEFMYECWGPKDKYYVEFGTESCQECTTRLLREKGWKGLLMDGSNENPNINLHKEFMTAENIVSLFKKYEVPITFDHLTIDVDQNTPYLMHSVLLAGYRPRQMVIEYNRNLHPNQSYMVVYKPKKMWDGSCWFGGSALAVERIAKAFGYSTVAFDSVGVNLFFVQDDILGIPFPNSIVDVHPVGTAFEPLHSDCANRLWVHVPETKDLTSESWVKHLKPVVLSHHPIRQFVDYHADQPGDKEICQHAKTWKPTKDSNIETEMRAKITERCA